MSNQPMVIEQGGALQQYAEPKPMTAADIKKQIGVIQTVMQEVMKEMVHYGKIPGTNQQSLLKPGAEKIAATFRLAPDYSVDDLSTPDEARYRVTCKLISPSGVFVGSGLGEASTSEQKYKWRGAVCQEEYDATDESRRRIKYGRKQGGGHYTQQQVRQDPADLANTVLKMAAKRALVAAVLTATAASDLFAQDLEDLPPEVRHELMGDYGEGVTAEPSNKGGKASNAKAGKKKPPAQPQSRKQQQDTEKADKASKAAEEKGVIRPNQAKQIESKCGAVGVELDGLLKAFDIPSIDQLPAEKFRDALDWITGEAG